ncbi:hypothetical protein [Pedobacter zeae]|uniref:Uncharacterized protein n=1 Tax=Pedobacter zeae TaxID=1737356 RepID=A0A7W6K9Q4_9SPHI|nr:hypothetical protein [Pedobacter zeae]MBB4107697.1 hypothetical protein [Pedobacter zeae]GGG97645.1 hypothetical protein GCM10007422_09550 [Pedobacter zeae]
MEKIGNTISQNHKQEVYDRLLLNHLTKQHKEEIKEEKSALVRNLTVAALLAAIITGLHFLA